MKIQKIAVVLTVINLVLMSFLLAQLQPAQAKQQQTIAPVLRGRALEIVDSMGKLRASITIEAPIVVDGVQYPETVLLRLRDPKGNPSVKLDASEIGGGLGLSDKADGGVRLIAKTKGSFVEVKSRNGKKVIEP